MTGLSEGWDWVRIQEAACPQCGQHPGALVPQRLGLLATASATLWRAFLNDADDDYLRVNPGPDVWSPIQYGAHVRDMLRVFADRIVLAVAEENPSVAWFDPGPEGWVAYRHMAVDGLIDDLQDQADRFATIVGELADQDWSRTAMRDGIDRFTVAGLACFGVHESHHHLLDATGSIRIAF